MKNDLGDTWHSNQIRNLDYENLLLQAYGRDLMEAQDWCRKYQKNCNDKDLTQAWDLYYHVFRRISKQLPQVIELSYQNAIS